MPFARLLKTITLGLVSLWGGFILIGLVVCLRYWFHGPSNPNGVPLEDWSLGLAIYIALIQLSSSLEALIIGFCTRFRWIKFNRGRLAVGLFTLIPLGFTASAIARGITESHVNVFWVLLYELIVTLPLWFAWFLLRSQRTQPSNTQLP